MSAGEYEVSRRPKVVEGDCLLRTFERNFLRMRWGIMVGIEGGQEKGGRNLE